MQANVNTSTRPIETQLHLAPNWSAPSTALRCHAAELHHATQTLTFLKHDCPISPSQETIPPGFVVEPHNHGQHEPEAGLIHVSEATLVPSDILKPLPRGPPPQFLHPPILAAFSASLPLLLLQSARNPCAHSLTHYWQQLTRYTLSLCVYRWHPASPLQYHYVG